MDAITRVTFYDKLVAFVVVVIVLAIIILEILGRAVSQYLVDAFVACLGWVLRGGAQVANEWYHTRRSVQNDGTVIGPTGGPGAGAGAATGGSGDAV